MPKVKYTIDSKALKNLSQDDLARADAIQESDIDYSDIPELSDDFFNRAKKERLTVRFDADMVDWFKSQGRGYQTRMNAVLRAFYEQHQ